MYVKINIKDEGEDYRITCEAEGATEEIIVVLASANAELLAQCRGNRKAIALAMLYAMRNEFREVLDDESHS